MKQQKKAYFLALIAVLFWSTMSSAFKITLGFISFEQLLFWSALMGITTLFVILLHQKQLTKEVFKPGSLINSAVMGLFNPFLYYLVLFKAYDLLEAQVAGVLNYSWPIVLVILSVIFLKQKIPFYSFFALLISFAGIIIIGTKGAPLQMKFDEPLGVGLALLSALFWGIYWILNLKDKKRSSQVKIFFNLVFGLIYLLIYLWIKNIEITLPSWQAILGAVYIGLFELSITFVIWLTALKLSSNTAKVSNLVYLSPVIALFWIWLTVGEKIHLSTVVGLFFIVGGIFIQQLLGRQTRN